MLTPIGEKFVEKISGHRREFVMCRCKCGNEIKMRTDSLKTGKYKSCGCRWTTKGRIPPNKTHGDSKGSGLYATWQCMKARCYCETNPAYKYYGAKGIKVCEAWHDYTVFKDWAIATGWKKSLHCDRIDVTKGYCPENCQWLTGSQNTKKMNDDRTKELADAYATIAALQHENATLRAELRELQAPIFGIGVY